jgi:hypothetical protein
MISPKTTRAAVEMKKPSRPLVRSDMRIDVRDITATLPTSSVQSSRLLSFRTGMILCVASGEW